MWFPLAKVSRLSLKYAKTVWSAPGSWGYAEWLNTAEYPDVLEQLGDDEVPIFRAAAGEDAEDEFQGLRAVILHRLQNETLDGMQSAIRLFRWTLECGFFLCDESDQPPKCSVIVADIHQFAPLLLERINSRVPAKRPAWDSEPDAFGATFRPLLPAIVELRKVIAVGNWLRNDLAVGLFDCLYNLYYLTLREYYGDSS